MKIAVVWSVLFVLMLLALVAVFVIGIWTGNSLALVGTAVALWLDATKNKSIAAWDALIAKDRAAS